jgi:rubrerythrin
MRNQRMTHTPVAPELGGIEIEGMTRSAFILRGALATGAVYGMGAVAPYVENAFASVTTGDLKVFEFALTLEYVEAAFYQAALTGKKLSAEVEAVATEFGEHEQEHVDTITKAIKQLGAKAPAAPKVNFQIPDEKAFLKLAVALEETGVAAYSGAAPAIFSRDLLEAAGSIVQVEARHAALIRLQRNRPPAPLAFDTASDADSVLAAVKPFIKA